MTTGHQVAPPSYYEKVPQRDSFDVLDSLEAGPHASTSSTSQHHQETYPIPNPLPWTSDEVRHHVTYQLKPPASLAHLKADCAGVLGRTHDVRANESIFPCAPSREEQSQDALAD